MNALKRPSSAAKRPSSAGVPKGKPPKPGSGGRKGTRLEDLEEPHAPPNLDGTGLLTWSFLTAEELEELDQQQPEQAAETIATLAACPQWKEDLRSTITVSILLNAYLFAKESSFTPAQTSTFCSLVKILVDSAVAKGLPMPETLAAARRLLVCHAGAGPERPVVAPAAIPATSRPGSSSKPAANVPSLSEPAGKAGAGAGASVGAGAGASTGADSTPTLVPPEWCVFNESQVRTITDYLMTSLFQHYRLYTAVYTTEQPPESASLHLPLESLPPLPDLATAVTQQAWEEEQERVREAERKQKEEEEEAKRRMALMPPDPLAELTPDEIARVVTETIQGLLAGVAGTFEEALEVRQQGYAAKLQAAAAEAILRTRG